MEVKFGGIWLKELAELLGIIKNEFPDKSIDISESMDLLLGTIVDIISLATEKCLRVF